MENTFPAPRHRAFYIGLSGIVVCLIIYLAMCIIGPSADGLCMVVFLVPFTFFFVLMSQRYIFWNKKEVRHPGVVGSWVVMCFISCHALNRCLPVLNASPAWFAILQAFSCATILAYAWYDGLPEWGRHVLFFCTGMAILVFAYLALYLVPLYIFSACICWAAGIPLHTFVPLYCIAFLVATVRQTGLRGYVASFTSGMGLLVLITCLHAAWWNNETMKINRLYNRAMAENADKVPAWVAGAQQMPHNFMSKRILEAGLVYDAPQQWNTNSFFVGSFDFIGKTRTYDKQKINDPLVAISSLCSPALNIGPDDRVQVLKSMYSERHVAQDRLWSGDDLRTVYVNSAVQIWPAYRVAYTQLTMGVQGGQEIWFDQEAIYSFHLPEGSVATSLSLWIDGKESKGVLTTKEKADSAYKEIVGYQRRDPSVLHWQEGNVVTVRIFPVTSKETRMFKIGITTPLVPGADQRLHYEPLRFEGPSALLAQEDLHVDLLQDADDVSMPGRFTRETDHRFTHEGHYTDTWQLSMKAPAIDSHPFVYNGNAYTVQPLASQDSAINVKAVYLDLNRSWTRQEFDAVWTLVKDHPTYAATNAVTPLQRVTDKNRDAVFEQAQKTRFSLFPFQEISDPATTLLISKSVAATPDLDDLRNSVMTDSLKAYLQQVQSIHVFDLGDAPSPYLASLKACRAFHYQQGSLEMLTHLWQQQVFPQAPEDNQHINISGAGLTIVRAPLTDNVKSQAPDHLMRLFAFNDILRRSGPRLLIEPVTDSAIINEAVEANIVSPASSLVVLETQQDYDRFDIHASKDGLHNATLQQHGAVPEPGEWALIIAVAGLLVYAWFGNRFKFKRTA